MERQGTFGLTLRVVFAQGPRIENSTIGLGQGGSGVGRISGVIRSLPICTLPLYVFHTENWFYVS